LGDLIVFIATGNSNEHKIWLNHDHSVHILAQLCLYIESTLQMLLNNKEKQKKNEKRISQQALTQGVINKSHITTVVKLFVKNC